MAQDVSCRLVPAIQTIWTVPGQRPRDGASWNGQRAEGGYGIVCASGVFRADRGGIHIRQQDYVALPCDVLGLADHALVDAEPCEHHQETRPPRGSRVVVD